MVVNIYNVILKFIGLGILDNYQANIKIYDSNNNLVYQGRTNNGKLYINLESNCVYKLVACNYNSRIITSFYVLNGKNKYTFILDNMINKTKTITFLLRDANYNNLPIEKGKMLFG